MNGIIVTFIGVILTAMGWDQNWWLVLALGVLTTISGVTTFICSLAGITRPVGSDDVAHQESPKT